MAGEWATATVAELQRQGILFVEDGNHGEYRPLADEFVEIGTPFIRPDDLKDGRVDFVNCDRINDRALARVRKGKGRAGDIVFTHRATVGRIARIGLNDPPFVANPGVTVWRSNAPDVLDPVYLYFFMQTSAFMDQVWAEAGNTDTFPYVSLTQQRGLKISMPCIETQRAIAHILGTLDDKIELNRRMNETLEATARAIFKSWFVDFDPVRAKAAGRAPGLPRPLADLFPDRLVDSELGEIPEGWNIGLIEDLAHVSSGKRPDVRYPEPSELVNVPLWGGNGPMGFVPEAQTDDPILLTGRVGTLGSVFRITSPCWPSDNTLVLKAKQPRAFEYLFIQSKRIDFTALNRGSTQPLLTQTDLKEQPLLLPPETVLERFHTFADGLYARIDESESESRILAAIRDTLLPKLISGELRVDGRTEARAITYETGKGRA